MKVSGSFLIHFYVVARRMLFPTTLAPYASAVSNLKLSGGCFVAKNKSAPRNDMGI